jgi:serine/threonine-protein kinase HipA
LAPAFDLAPQPVTTRRRLLAMNPGELGAMATRENLLSSVDSFLLSVGEANQIVDGIAETIQINWQRLCREWGVSDEDASRIAGCFEHGAF